MWAKPIISVRSPRVQSEILLLLAKSKKGVSIIAKVKGFEDYATKKYSKIKGLRALKLIWNRFGTNFSQNTKL